MSHYKRQIRNWNTNHGELRCPKESKRGKSSLSVGLKKIKERVGLIESRSTIWVAPSPESTHEKSQLTREEDPVLLGAKTRFLRAQFVEAPSSQQCIRRLCSSSSLRERRFKGFFWCLDRSCFGVRNDGHLPKPGGWRNGLNDPRHQHDQGERATQRGAGPGQGWGETRPVPETAVFLRCSHCYGHPGELREAPHSVRHLSIYHQQVSILWEK